MLDNAKSQALRLGELVVCGFYDLRQNCWIVVSRWCWCGYVVAHLLIRRGLPCLNEKRSVFLVCFSSIAQLSSSTSASVAVAVS